MSSKQTLQSLSLGGNQISDEGAEGLAVAVDGHPSLAKLQLGNNLVGPRGAGLLGAALKVPTVRIDPPF